MERYCLTRFLFTTQIAERVMFVKNSLFTDESRIATLKKRAKRCCCKQCGGELEVRRIVFSDFEDARIEIFCTACDRIEYGVEPEIYQNAAYFVDTLKFNHYPELSQNALTRKMNIAKVCDIITWACKNMGFLNADGFAVSVRQNELLLGENLILTDEDINRMQE